VFDPFERERLGPVAGINKKQWGGDCPRLAAIESNL